MAGVKYREAGVFNDQGGSTRPMWSRWVICGIAVSLLGLSAWGTQITYYIDERGRRVYINAEEPPKKAAPASAAKKNSTRHSVLVKRDPRTGKMVPVAAPPDPKETAPAMAAQAAGGAGVPAPVAAAAAPARPRNEAQPAAGAPRQGADKSVDDIIDGAAEKHAVDPHLVRAIVKVESNFNPGAISRKGAMGLMQLIPQTARRLGVSDIFDPQENVDAGVRYLKYLLALYNGNLRLSLAAYNAGEKAVDRHSGIPPYPETRQYVNKISSLYGSGYIVNPFGLSISSQARQARPDRWGIMKRLDEHGRVHFSNTEGW
jgi:soluble lytic murein transglycosylase-like protein